MTRARARLLGRAFAWFHRLSADQPRPSPASPTSSMVPTLTPPGLVPTSVLKQAQQALPSRTAQPALGWTDEIRQTNTGIEAQHQITMRELQEAWEAGGPGPRYPPPGMAGLSAALEDQCRRYRTWTEIPAELLQAWPERTVSLPALYDLLCARRLFETDLTLGRRTVDVTHERPKQTALTTEEFTAARTIGTLKRTESRLEQKIVGMPPRPTHDEVLAHCGGNAAIAEQAEQRLDTLFGPRTTQETTHA